jgi:hypothetical protein
MNNSAQRSRAVFREKCGHGQSRRHSKIYGNLPKTTTKSAAIVPASPILRITPAAQLEIIDLYLRGCSLCEIARQTHRARQTVTKICRSDEVQAKIQEVRGKLLGCSDKWVESIGFALDNELDGRVALELAERFGAIPVLQQPPANAYPLQQTTLQSIDRETFKKAAIIGMVALERGKVFAAELPTEEEELHAAGRTACVRPSVRRARSGR